MDRKVVLFDIDRTLLDTGKMIKEFDKLLFSILGDPNYEDYKNAELDYFKTLSNERYFSPHDYARFMSTRFKKGVDSLISEVFYSDKHNHIYSTCVFRESTVILDDFVKKYTLGIYSEGTSEFQNHKFNSLGLSHYFDKRLIFIVDAKATKEMVERIPPKSVIIDDKETICQFLTENGFRAIWVNRKDDRKSKSFETIYSLLELPVILK